MHLHLDRIAHIFVGEEERSKLPAGFLAWYDGLLAAVAENDGTASMAWGKYQRQKLSADRTVWAEVWGFFGNVISDDCFSASPLPASLHPLRPCVPASLRPCTS